MDEITHRIIGCAMAVHSGIGPGLLEKAYDVCVRHELSQQALSFRRQVAMPVRYKGIQLDAGFRVDYVIENCVVLELKAVEKLHSLHTAQLLSYLKLSHYTIGLLINFNVVHLRDGIKRIVNNYQG